MPGVGQVNQKIARHTQNSAAQWNLNSARAVELNSLRNPAHPPRAPSPLPLPLPSFPFLFSSLSLRRASYSLSFVIRKQTERRSCQVGGVGDETAVSVRPSFFRLRRRPPRESTIPLTSFTPFSTYPYPVQSSPPQIRHHIFRCVDGPPDSLLRLRTIMSKERAAKEADSIIHCQTQATATARYFAFFSCLPFFLRRAAISLRDKERERERRNKSDAKD